MEERVGYGREYPLSTPSYLCIPGRQMYKNALWIVKIVYKYKEGNNRPSSTNQISLVHNNDKAGNKRYTQDKTNTREKSSREQVPRKSKLLLLLPHIRRGIKSITSHIWCGQVPHFQPNTTQLRIMFYQIWLQKPMNLSIVCRYVIDHCMERACKQNVFTCSKALSYCGCSHILSVLNSHFSCYK